MEHLLGFFSKSSNKSEKSNIVNNNIVRKRSYSNPHPHPSPRINNNNLDIKLSNKDLETLRSQNYDRSNFNYETLSKIGWWPDEILKFVEINRLSYIEFIQIFNNKCSMFDIPIRNAIYFMNQIPYCNDDQIRKFIKHRTTDISDNYWNKVVDEDNCYMEGLESRNRSNNENQHYYLLCALIKLISYKNISIDNLILKPEYIKKIKIFIAIYHLKNAHSMIDDILRTILQSCINKETNLDIYLPKIFYDMNSDIDKKILLYARSTSDNDLMNRSYLFRDIILYAVYKTTQFSFVYNYYNDFINNNILSDFKDNYITPFNHSKYLSLFTLNDIKRIEYVYLNLNDKIINKQQKTKLILENIDFTKLIEKNESLTSNRPRILTPKYSLKNNSFKLNNSDYPIFYVDAEDKYKHPHENKHIKRIVSLDKIHRRTKSVNINDKK